MESETKRSGNPALNSRCGSKVQHICFPLWQSSFHFPLYGEVNKTSATTVNQLLDTLLMVNGPNLFNCWFHVRLTNNSSTTTVPQGPLIFAPLPRIETEVVDSAKVDHLKVQFPRSWSCRMEKQIHCFKPAMSILQISQARNPSRSKFPFC